jgi:Flp pilus assembly protein TadG
MTRLQPRHRSSAHRRRSLGQSLVEMSLLAPALVVLAGGCGQVGIIAYGAASVETSARSAARVAAEYPNRSLDFVGTLGVSTYTCGQAPSDAQTENSVCAAARSSAGLLSGSSLTITITSSSAITRVADDVVQIGNTCPGGALETGTVGNLPAGLVATISSPSKASSGTVLSDSAGSYSICLSAPSNSQGDQPSSITATAVDASGCTYNTSVGITVTTAKTVTPSPATMTLPSTGVCPVVATPTPSPTATASPTASPTGMAWQGQSLPTPAPQASCSSSVSDTSYVQVTVAYNAPVFVPLVGKYFESPAGSGTRTVTATQRMQVEPCTVTQGG